MLGRLAHAMPNDVKDQILAFYHRLAGDRHHRYRSWEHCYQHFQQRALFAGQQQVETAALHLAFYLASWGMYRGSSFLLQRDYSIHLDAVSTLLQPQYEPLWSATFNDATNDETAANLICSLSDALKATYRQHIGDENVRRRNPTDTLITKILLGTVGCAPACDRYFILGFRHRELMYSQFSASFLRQVFRFYRDHAEALNDAQSAIVQQGGIRYPIMKLIDMYFWEIGFTLLPDTDENSTGA